MNSLRNTNDIRPDNPFERMIFENGVRIIDVKIYKERGFMVFVLNSCKVITVDISLYPRLMKASEKKMKKWNIIEGGIGVEWKDINYDISLKNILENHFMQNVQPALQLM